MARALTLVTCLGFALVSLQTTGWLAALLPAPYLYLPLALGPLLGLWELFGV